jgi:adenylosuccinate synthase
MDDEISPEEAEAKGWSEFGTVTGRKRRSSKFNFDLARRAVMLNSATQISITKLDVIFPDCAGKTLYSDLSNEAQLFIKNIEEELKTPVTIIGTGPAVNEIIDRRN